MLYIASYTTYIVGLRHICSVVINIHNTVALLYTINLLLLSETEVGDIKTINLVLPSVVVVTPVNCLKSVEQSVISNYRCHLT